MNDIRQNPNYDSNGNIVANSKYYSSNSVGKLSGYTIMVNAGHGGYNQNNMYFDCGAAQNGAEEWEINVEYAQALAEQLLKKAFKENYIDINKLKKYFK